MSYNTGDDAQVKERKTRAQLEREKELAQLKQILDMKAGRAFLWRLLHKAKLYYDQRPSNDLHDTYFLMGQRHVALELRKEIIEADPHAYLRMQTEAGDS